MIPRHLKRALAALVAAVFLIAGTYGAALAGQKKLTKDEAQLLMKQIGPDIEVVSVGDSPIEGLWEIIVLVRGQTSVIYIDASLKNVVVGSIVNIGTKSNLTKLRLDEVNRVDVKQIPLDDALVMGDKDARHRVIVFDDPD